MKKGGAGEEEMSEPTFPREMAEDMVRARIEERLEEEYEEKRMVVPALTISRQLGSGGRVLAGKVGERLDWSVWDAGIVDRIAEDAGLRRELVEDLDERIKSDLHSAMAELFGREILDSLTFKRRLVETILSIARGGRCIFVGRGANFALPQAFHVRVCAPEDVRLRNLMQFDKLTEEVARKRIRSVERERAKFIRKHFRCENIGDPLLYDLVINTGRCSLDAAAEVIVMCVRERFGLGAG